MSETLGIKTDMDYIGFTYNGIHSSELGIVRTSDGSRFNENLLPVIQDKTTTVPGGDGTYYYGSYFTQKQFNVSFAFDSLTEEQFARLKKLFGDKKVHELIFDEAPYKVYQAKVTGSATIKHIPFAEGATNRVYKGEGNVQFTAYTPYARSVYKYADQYNVNNYIEWKDAANLLETQGNFDTLDGNVINLYNPGDKEADFILSFNFDTSGIIPAGGLIITEEDGTIHQLHFKKITKQGNDEQIKINSKLNLIEGYSNGRKTGKVYDRFITKGTYFKIPQSVETDAPLQLVIENSNNLANYFDSIEYNYIYF